MLCYEFSFSYNSKITELFLEPIGANDFAPTVLELQRIYLQAHQRKDRNCCERKMLALIGIASSPLQKFIKLRSLCRFELLEFCFYPQVDI